MGGGQQLSSPGSCLEVFRPNAYIECNSRGECHFFSDKYTFWLVSTADQNSFSASVQGRTLKAGQILQHVSRCVVCVMDVNHPVNQIRPTEPPFTTSPSIEGSGELTEGY